MTLRFSRRLAVLLGIVTPSIETVRRWSELRTLTVWWPTFVDDVLLGGFLLYGAWLTGRDVVVGRPVLAAAWGFTSGLAYYSFFGQLSALDTPDPSGVSPVLVVTIKGLGFALALAGLASALGPAGGAPTADVAGQVRSGSA